jgi:hypothetical protein
MSIIEANLSLPAIVQGYGNGTNTIGATAGTWGTLVTAPISLTMTNPSADYDLVVDVSFGAWMASSTGDVRYGIALTGGMTVSPGPGTNNVAGYGLLPTTQQTNSTQQSGFMVVTIPKGAAAVNFVGQGYRSNGASTAQVNYPTLVLEPRRFI